jgi:hypothetical protein
MLDSATIVKLCRIGSAGGPDIDRREGEDRCERNHMLALQGARTLDHAPHPTVPMLYGGLLVAVL